MEVVVKEIIAECLGVDVINLKNEEKLSRLGMDSLDVFHLEFQLNKAFDGQLISELIIEDETTVQDILNYIETELNFGRTSNVLE